MPLDRTHITVASRVMLPTYCAFFTLLGVNYIATPFDTITASPALRFANAVMPLPVWGGLFLACAAVMLAALVVKRRIPFRFALRVCMLSMLVWAGIIGAAAIAGDATLLAPIWPGFVAIACLASDRSLATREA